MPSTFIKSSQKVKDSKTKIPRCCYHKVINGEADKSKIYIQKRVNGECKYLIQKGGAWKNSGDNYKENVNSKPRVPSSTIFALAESQVKPRFSNLSTSWRTPIDEGNENEEEEQAKRRKNAINMRKAIPTAERILGYSNSQRRNENTMNKLNR